VASSDNIVETEMCGGVVAGRPIVAIFPQPSQSELAAVKPRIAFSYFTLHCDDWKAFPIFGREFIPAV